MAIEIRANLVRSPIGREQGGDGEAAALDNAIPGLTQAWMFAFERALDTALQTFAKGGDKRGHKLKSLNARANFDGLPLDQLARIRVPVTVLADRNGKHLYLDIFDPKGNRSFEFFLYDRSNKSDPTPETATLDVLVLARRRQLQYFLVTFGEYFPLKPPSTGAKAAKGDSKATQERINGFAARRRLLDRVGGGHDLRSEDGMASFLVAFFKTSGGEKGSADERLKVFEEVLRIVDGFGQTQTMHSLFNLAETPSYLGRDFPRCLLGRPLHDCGVYAVKAAYILLKFASGIPRKADVAKPDAAFVLTPLHIALTVKLDQFPAVIVHNDQLSWLRPEVEAEWRKAWDEDSTDAPGIASDHRFIEDRVAQHYIQFVDMPVKRVALDDVSLPPKMNQVWSVYDRASNGRDRVHLFSDEIEKSNSDVYQHDLDFLKLLMVERDWFNATMVSFWNERCHRVWLDHVAQIDKWSVRQRYVKALRKELTPVKESYQTAVRTPRSNFRVKAKALTAPPPRVTDGGRLAAQVERDIGMFSSIDAHLGEVADRSVKEVKPPPFADENGFLQPML